MSLFSHFHSIGKLPSILLLDETFRDIQSGLLIEEIFLRKFACRIVRHLRHFAHEIKQGEDWLTEDLGLPLHQRCFRLKRLPRIRKERAGDPESFPP